MDYEENNKMSQQVNFVTGNAYSGKNYIELSAAPFESNKWATYIQWQQAGFQVQKGSKGYGVQAVKTAVDDDGTKKSMVKWYRVFNEEQVQAVEA